MTADGLLVVAKPAGLTSHDVVARVRRLAGTRKVGHAGTLDPMATGVLVVGVNKATRLLTFLVGCDKTYEATIRLGQSTVTDDAEGEVTTSVGASGLDAGALTAAVAALTGDIQQVPSSVSAIKVAGERSYARVRAGESVELAARPVRVSRFEVLATRELEVDGVRVTDLDVVVEVSSGTYVRALARDLGGLLGVGGHLTALHRSRVGGFTDDDAHDLVELASYVEDGRPLPMMTLEQAGRLALPTRELTEPDARALSYGQRIDSGEDHAAAVAAYGPDGVLVAVLDESQARTRSLVVFTPAAT